MTSVASSSASASASASASGPSLVCSAAAHADGLFHHQPAPSVRSWAHNNELRVTGHTVRAPTNARSARSARLLANNILAGRAGDKDDRDELARLCDGKSSRLPHQLAKVVGKGAGAAVGGRGKCSQTRRGGRWQDLVDADDLAVSHPHHAAHLDGDLDHDLEDNDNDSQGSPVLLSNSDSESESNSNSNHDEGALAEVARSVEALGFDGSVVAWAMGECLARSPNTPPTPEAVVHVVLEAMEDAAMHQ